MSCNSVKGSSKNELQEDFHLDVAPAIRGFDGGHFPESKFLVQVDRWLENGIAFQENPFYAHFAGLLQYSRTQGHTDAKTVAIRGHPHLGQFEINFVSV